MLSLVQSLSRKRRMRHGPSMGLDSSRAFAADRMHQQPCMHDGLIIKVAGKFAKESSQTLTNKYCHALHEVAILKKYRARLGGISGFEHASIFGRLTMIPLPTSLISRTPARPASM